MASAGEPWHRQESRADHGRAVPTTGEPCRRWERVPGSATTSEGRQRRQRVGNDVRGSATTSEGRHCHQRVGTVTRGSALSPEGRHCRQRSHGIVRKDVTLQGWTWHRRDGRGAIVMDVEPSQIR